MKFLFISLLIFVIAGTPIRPGSLPAHPTPFTIAVVDAKTEASGKPGSQSIYAGVKLAADQMNARGYDIRVIAYADNNDVNAARRIAAEIAASDAIAVIGHARVETSDAAAAIYDNRQLPLLGVIAANAQLAESHPYYFNITYTAESQAAYLANYLRKIQGQGTASVIFNKDVCGDALARKFTNVFTGLGGRITYREGLGQQASDQEIEEVVSKLVRADPNTESPGAIFIAVDEETAARLIVKMRQRGLAYPIVGANHLSSPQFIERMSKESEEKVQAGTLTDGILTTSSVIFDSTSRYAHQFLEDYRRAYPQDNTLSSINNDYNRGDPGNDVVNGYDAALAIFSAAQRVDLSPNDVQANRAAIYEALTGMDSANTGVEGVAGSLYFETSRNAGRTARFGVYQNGQLISAMTQFEPVPAPELFKREDLQEQLEKKRIMTVNGKYVYVANVVYAGVDMIDVHDVDIKSSTYVMDFYLWFRYRANLEDQAFKPATFVFTNAVSFEEVSYTPVREPETINGMTAETYRVTGTFKSPFHFYEYPFDTQDLTLQFRNQEATTTFVQYVVDRIGMQYQSEEALTKHFKDNGAFNALNGWRVNEALAHESVFSTTSTLGNPQNFGNNISTDFSLINLSIEIQRNSLQFIIKSLLPLLFTLILAYITFFLPLGHSERLGVGSTALLTTAFFHLSLADSLPQIGYTVAMEYLFYAAYLMSALIVFLETISIRLEKRSEAEKDEQAQQEYQKKREKLNYTGRLVYPLILAVVLAGGSLVYSGILDLEPRAALDGQHLIARLIEQKVQTQETNYPTQAVQQPSDGRITLSLGTWRPEDTENMGQLLAEFRNYALETYGRDILIEYEAVVGSNYDSLLSARLARGQAPDLFYVHPYSVDGDLSRHLVELSSLGIPDKYDENESSAWQNSSDKRYYALPYVGVVQGVYYNRGFFERYGLKEPATWEQFVKLAEAIEAHGKIPVANALNERQDSEMFQSILAGFIGGPEGRARFDKTDGTNLCFDNYRLVYAFQAVEDLRPYLLPNAATMDDTRGKEAFISQDAIMLFGGSWDVEYFSDKVKFNWSVFAPPAPAGKQTHIIFQPDAGLGINKASPHKEEALLFLKWLMAEGARATEKYLPGRYPLINAAGTSDGAASGHDADFAKLTTSYPSDIRWLFTGMDSQYPRSSEIVRQALHDMIHQEPSSEGTPEYLTAQEAAMRLQAGLSEWYEPAQTCR
jgi:branched-chain amino acid transport system substrate-binding protein